MKKMRFLPGKTLDHSQSSMM